jgi:toxin ParE1/3/4
MRYRIILTPEAEADLQQIQTYIAERSFPQNAARYVDRLTDAIERLAVAPFQGTSREDIGPGFRTTGFERREKILYAVRGEQIIIAGIFHGGRQIPKRFIP